MPTTVALLAQYHPHGLIPPHTRAMIASLLDAGCGVHVACATDSDIAIEHVSDLERRGARFYPRRNGGLDFASWQMLLDRGCANGADRVVLVNDSVLGPFEPLGPILTEMADCRAWGMVASRQVRPHLQSWFVCLEAGLLRQPAMISLLAQDFARMTRQEIILRGEIGLTTAIEAVGVMPAARWPWAARDASWWGPQRVPWRRAAERWLPPVNPAHADWQRMRRAVPFLKIELLRDDPAHLAPRSAWVSHLARLAYPVAWADAAIAILPRRPHTALNWRGRFVHRLRTFRPQRLSRRSGSARCAANHREG